MIIEKNYNSRTTPACHSHFSAVKSGFLAELAERLKAKNLLLWHTEEKNLANRRELYTAETKQYFSGKVFVPEDLETVLL